jgi:MFS family permease
MAQVLSELGDWAARIALAVLVFDRTKSSALTGLVTAASLLPWLGPGQLLATLGDRFPRRSVMVATDLARAILFGLMVLPVPVWALLVAALAAGFVTPIFETAKSALLPELVERRKYGDAIRLTQLTYQAALLLGYLAGGGLVALVGPELALGINAASFTGSALFVMRLIGGRASGSADRGATRLATAVKVLTRDSLLRRAVLLATIPTSFAIAGEALVAVYVRQEVSAGDWAIGALAASVPVGTILAGLLIKRTGDHRRMLRSAAGVGLGTSAVGAVLFIASPDLPVAFLPFLAAGAIFSIIVPANAVGGARIADDVRASAFGLIQGLVTGGQAIGVLAGGLVAQAVGAGAASGILLIPSALYCLFASASVPEMRVASERRVPERRESLLTGAGASR